MTLTCSKCSRLNPVDATYCYFDGTALAGRGLNGGPVNVGTQTFHNPFVFPSGHICRNFDQLGLACQENWSEALEMLRKGYLKSFLGSLGRIDLARAAHDAARAPDRDRGLDQFLGMLPSGTLQRPRLRVEPTEINLGLLQCGEDRRFDLTLENQGMRLLYGSATCVDCVWLSLGDASGVGQKVFEFHGEHFLPVHVRGKYLRAGNKPLEGRIALDTNGGKITVTVRADVPVKPFPMGVLAGSMSPRQVAEKAKVSPHEAAGLMEKGAVARWYRDNGWTYPVQGPPASGLGAVQQFFEALGLTTPPKVDISELTVQLRGEPGDMVQHELVIKAREKRPVFAHASSDRQWLEVGRARLQRALGDHSARRANGTQSTWREAAKPGARDSQWQPALLGGGQPDHWRRRAARPARRRLGHDGRQVRPCRPRQCRACRRTRRGNIQAPTGCGPASGGAGRAGGAPAGGARHGHSPLRSNRRSVAAGSICCRCCCFSSGSSRWSSMTPSCPPKCRTPPWWTRGK